MKMASDPKSNEEGDDSAKMVELVSALRIWEVVGMRDHSLDDINHRDWKT